jgi:hypothetical protein
MLRKSLIVLFLVIAGFTMNPVAVAVCHANAINSDSKVYNINLSWNNELGHDNHLIGHNTFDDFPDGNVIVNYLIDNDWMKEVTFNEAPAYELLDNGTTNISCQNNLYIISIN